MTLEILKPGILTTVQDLGRPGSGALGVSPGGALDAPALETANRLVGNPPGACALEVVAGPLAIRLHGDGWLAFCGADFEAQLDGRPLRRGWRAAYISGQVLTLNGPRAGMRAVLAFGGGIAVPQILGGGGTDLGAGFGGWHGRALAAGDRLPLGPGVPLARAVGVAHTEADGWVRALPGPEYEQFEQESLIWDSDWRISPQSNRMGMRLAGPVLARTTAGDLPSHAVLPGVVQVPPDGQPIVLLADAQATGGYPRIAVVIAADLWKLAQARPGTALRLRRCDIGTARRALVQQRQDSYRLARSLEGT
jgi:biotin-dependent carboxylase-like uncharacterized protein